MFYLFQLPKLVTVSTSSISSISRATDLLRGLAFLALVILTLLGGTEALLAEPSPALPILRARGSLLGLAYGDGLGAVTEAYEKSEIENIFGKHLSLEAPLPLTPINKILNVRGEKNYWRTRIPGFTTDDTQQALVLIRTLLQHPNWGDEGLEAFSQSLLRGYREGAWRGTGSTFRQAMKHLEKGLPYNRSGVPSAGMGAAMRVGGLGGIQGIPPEKIAEAAITSSLVTHADIHAAALSYAVYQTSRWLVEGRPIEEIRAHLPIAVEQIEDEWAQREGWDIFKLNPHSLSTVLKQVLSQISHFHPHPHPSRNPGIEADLTQPGSMTKNEKISQWVIEFATPYLEPGNQLNQIHPNGAFVLLGGIHSLALALQDEVSPLETLQYVVNLGNDTDTVGAILGSLLGARFGPSWIPLSQLIEGPRLNQYAGALISGVLPENDNQFFDTESWMTHGEQRFQIHLKEGIPVPTDCSKILNFLNSSS